MKRKILIFITIAFVIFANYGCIFGRLGTPAPYYGKETALYTMAAFSIPEVEQMGTIIEQLDSDGEGRILFRVKFGNTGLYYKFFGKEAKWITAYAVCQYYDEETVYYYEDFCFVICPNEEDFTPNEQSKLKNVNDWGKPLDYEKMTRRSIIPKDSDGRKISNLSIDSWEATKIRDYYSIDILKKKGFLTSDKHSSSEFLDIDKDGRIILVITVWETYDSSGDFVLGSGTYEIPGEIDISSIQAFIELYDIRDSGKSAVIEEINDIYSLGLQLSELKRTNGWR